MGSSEGWVGTEEPSWPGSQRGRPLGGRFLGNWDTTGWRTTLLDAKRGNRSDECEPAVSILDLGVDRLEEQGLDLLGDRATRAVADLNLVDGADR